MVGCAVLQGPSWGEVLVTNKEYLTAKEETSLKRSRELARWRGHSSEIRNRWNLPLIKQEGSAPWTSRPSTRLKGLAHSERQRDLLDVVWAVHRKNNATLSLPELIRGFFANPSQSVLRLPSCHGRVPTLCSSSEIYSYEYDAVLSGEAHLLLLGWPRNTFPSELFSNAELRSLAGESFALCTIAHIVYCYFLNPYGPWWTPS